MSEHAARALDLLIFDDGLGTFGPLTDARAAFDLRAGLGTLRERIEAAVGMTASQVFVAPALRELVAASLPFTTARGAAAEVLLVNGRLMSLAALEGIALDEVRETTDGVVIAARVPSSALAAVASEWDAVRAMLSTRAPSSVEAQLANAPWDITARIAQTLAEDVELFAKSPCMRHSTRRVLRPDEGQAFGKHSIFIDASASLGPYCVIDASKGPVVIGPHVVVRPFAVIVGPCAIMEGTIISERALIKASTVIGPHCRVGGEVGGTIFQSYSNKSHDGHLGDSFIGEWVNIGAGSDNSNLLNTYGEVIVRLDATSGLVRTGKQFWGSIVGDHCKLAIGTRLMTGTTIGTGAMIAQSRSPASLVPAFAWLVDGADGAKFFRFEKFMETAAAMMGRRGCAPSPQLTNVLRALHTRSTSGQ